MKRLVLKRDERLSAETVGKLLGTTLVVVQVTWLAALGWGAFEVARWLV